MGIVDFVSRTVGVVTTTVALASTVDSVTGIGLEWRLFVAFVAAIAVAREITSSYSRKYSKPGVLSIETKIDARMKATWLGLLALTSAIFAVVCFFLIDRLPFRSQRTESAGIETTRLLAPYAAIAAFDIRVAPGSCGNQKVIANAGGGLTPPDITMIEWDGQNPRLEVRAFQYPQQVGVSCRSKTYVAITPAAVAAQLYDTERLVLIKSAVIICGVLLWLLFAVRGLPRSSSA